MNSYIISLNNIPEALYLYNNEYKHKFVLNKYLIPTSLFLRKDECIRINGKAYIVEDTLYMNENIIINCKEEE